MWLDYYVMRQLEIIGQMLVKQLYDTLSQIA